MSTKSKRSHRQWRDPDDAPVITRKWLESANLYRGNKLVRRGADGFVARLASMPNVGADADFARHRTGRSAPIGPGRRTMAKTKFSPFNSADYLDNEDVIVAYLTAALENPDSHSFLMALSNAAKARGIEKGAKHSGLGRRALQKALAPGAKPPFDTVHKVMNALGVRWAVVLPTAPRLAQIRERLAHRPAVTTRITAAEVLRRERTRR